ncbi:MAG TPA: DUF2177 family protein [Candidatus Paceibacterota bacterium]
MQTLKTLLAIIIPLIVIDGLWLFTAGKAIYPKFIGHLMAPDTTWIPIIIFYLLYTVGLFVYVVNPSLHANTTWIVVLVKGLLFGLVAYGAYDLTNHATLLNWKTPMTIIDMAWGATVTGLASLIAYLWVK